MRESEIEIYFTSAAKAIGAEVRKQKWINRDGAPDRVLYFNSFICFVEFKAPKEKLKPAQKREIALLRKHGIPVFVIDDMAQATLLLNVVEEKCIEN